MLDPEIAALLGDDDDLNSSGGNDAPDFAQLFDEGGSVDAPSASEDFTLKTFDEITVFEQEPRAYFDDPKYYSNLLNGLGEAAQSMHKNLTAFVKEKDVQNLHNLRERINPAFWNMFENLVQTDLSLLSLPKKFFLRFAIVAPIVLTKQQRDIFCRIIEEKTTDEPVYYLDEWLKNVSEGRNNPLESDEPVSMKTSVNAGNKTRELLENASGQISSQKAEMQTLQSTRNHMEKEIASYIQTVSGNNEMSAFSGIQLPYSNEQKSMLSAIISTCHNLTRTSNDMSRGMANLEKLNIKEEDLKAKLSEEPSGGGIRRDLRDEAQNIRQTFKMTIGRNGNHFPVMFHKYCPPQIKEVGTRENIISQLREIEFLDPEVFQRQFRRQINRIVPNIILLPCYGEFGICWVPFEKFNRATSRGQVLIPMYSKNLKITVLTAVASLRWEVAKEKAMNFWMSEGLTGKYYDYFTESKMKGQVKDCFIRDYILWHTKEALGMQKLEKEIRGIFWRMMPFPEELRESLRKKGFVYEELYKKDVTRTNSLGY